MSPNAYGPAARPRCLPRFARETTMPKLLAWSLLAILFVVTTVWAADRNPAPPPPPARALTFEAHVRPILKAHCFHCHGDEPDPKGQLDLRLVRAMRLGGDSGPAITPGKHAESLLIERVESGEMPPGDKKLSATERATLARWIDQGAPTARPEPENVASADAVTEEERRFWSFQPIGRPTAPQLASAGMVRTPIDAFLLAELQRNGLSFSPEADKRTLIRRAYFDLLGLPPTPDEIALFLADEAPDAYDRLIDRLLASPRYGERWARHWLDVAGYSDSDGYSEKDFERKYAYKYRDYVIRSFNADRPFDQFIQEQLAGDEMVRPPYPALGPQDLDRLVATGFLRMGPDGTGDGSVDQPLARNEAIAETIKIVSTSLLGLTVGCAQCHNHRYDPISQTDYYRLRAIFEPAYNPTNWRAPSARLVSLMSDADRRRAAEVDAQIKALTAVYDARIQALMAERTELELAKVPEAVRAPLRAALAVAEAQRTPEQKNLLRDYPAVIVTRSNLYLYDRKKFDDAQKQHTERLEKVRATRPVEDFVHVLTDTPGKLPVTHVLLRGDHLRPGEAVAPGELTVLCSADAPPIPPGDGKQPSSGRRLAYARHLTDGRHPLVARVLVNRFWMHHFGRGLVATPGDFGALGARPSHPELLDWLASDFISGGWRLKRLHKLLMTSTAYRQVSTRGDAGQRVDPENRLLGRMSVRRLEAEEVRDAVLATSGKLNARMFGPPVPVMPDEVGQVVLGIDTRDTAGRPSGKVVALGDEVYRRSVYIQMRRSLPLGMLESFDAPIMTPNCEVRASSTVAPQSLLLMNNAFVVEQSQGFADRVAREAGHDLSEQVTRAWRLAYGGEAGEADRAAALAFLRDEAEIFGKQASPEAKSKSPPPDPARRALASFCQALLSSNAFLYVD